MNHAYQILRSHLKEQINTEIITDIKISAAGELKT